MIEKKLVNGWVKLNLPLCDKYFSEFRQKTIRLRHCAYLPIKQNCEKNYS